MYTDSRQPGFTLVELVIVSAIIALLASVAAPRFAGAIATRRLDAGVARLVADCALAQRHAYLISTEQTITFNPSKNTYTLDDMAPIDVGATEYAVNLSSEPYGIDIHAVNFGVDKQLVYSPYGTALSGGTVTLKRGTQARYITVGAETGRAREATLTEFTAFEISLSEQVVAQ